MERNNSFISLTTMSQSSILANTLRGFSPIRIANYKWTSLTYSFFYCEKLSWDTWLRE